MSMVIRGFVKHLGRGTITDQEIHASLVWTRDMINGVLGDSTDFTEPDTEPWHQEEAWANIPSAFPSEDTAA